MSTNGSFGVTPRRHRSRRAARDRRRRGLAIGIVSALSASLVFASGLAYANDPTPSPEPVDTALAATDAVETTPPQGESVEAPAVVVESVPTEVQPSDVPETQGAESTDSVGSTNETPQDAVTPEETAAPSSEADSSDQRALAVEDVVAARVEGPDGGTAPYLHWSVIGPNGKPLGGATFDIAEDTGGAFDPHETAKGLPDCTSQNCSGLDRDSEPGEYLLTHARGDNKWRLKTNTKYRVTPVAAPAGYTWVDPTPLTVSEGWGGATQAGVVGTFAVKAAAYNVTVNKGTYRTGAGATDISATNTVGVRFGMYQQGATEPFATCEIVTEGACVFENATPPNGNTNVIIREMSPVPGSPAARFLSEPIETLTTGTYSGSVTNRPYEIRANLADNNTLPQGGTQLGANRELTRMDRVANRVKNPQLAKTCDAGVNVAVVLDTSLSVGSQVHTLAKATTALINGLVGTPSKVALFSFGSSSPGAVSNKPVLSSVQTAAEAKAVIGLYSSNNGQTANFTAAGTTNWDHGLWTVAEAAKQHNKYDVVFVLTDGNPTTSSSGTVSTGMTTFRDIEQGTFSANALKATGARIVSVGVGGSISDHNLAAISGISKFETGKSLNEFDYVTADWAQLEGVLNSFAQGLKCEASVTVEKQAKPYGGAYAPAQGWKFGLASSDKATQIPAGDQTTDATGKAKWTLKFNKPTDEATATLTELEDRTGWSLADLTCDVGGTTVDLANKKVSIPGIGIGENITCTFKNEEKLVGALDITKALSGADAQNFGASVNFQGGYTCSLNNETVASGTWAKMGAGAATLTPAAGSPAANQIPANAVCTVTETTPTGGLPDASWSWVTPVVSGPVTITKNTTATVTVTNAVERVYGNFQVTKQLAAGSTADPTLTYSGGWTCTLGAEEVSGTWGPIEAGATWASTDAAGIPLGASCAVTSELRPQWPVANDHSHQWDGEAGFSAAVVSAKQDLGTVTVTNTTKQVLGSVTWSKVDATSQSLLGGSSWTIAGPSFPEPGELVEDCVADDPAQCVGLDTNPVEGEFALKDLLWGTYTVTETDVPTGYVGGVSFTFTVAEATLDVDKGAQANERRPGAVSWSKTDEDGDLLGGSVWTITPPEGGEIIRVGDCIALDAKDCTGADRDPAAGKFLVEGLAWGTHLIAEATPPQGYDGGASFSVEVAAEVAGTTISGGSHMNTARTGTLKWSKVDADLDKKPLLGGSEWTLKGPGDATRDVVDCVGTCSDDPFTDQDPVVGQFSIVGLVWGTYTLTEKTAPTGYVNSFEAETFTIDATNVTETVKYTIENTRETGNVTWSKVDATDASLLAGSVWTLKGPGEASRDIVDCIGTCSDDPFTDQDPVAGQFSIVGLVWGDYALTEKTAPTGYVESTEPIEFTIDATNVAGIRHLGDIGNERIPGSVGWTKVDGAGTLLAGSEWSLTAPDGTTMVVEDCIETSDAECLGPDQHSGAGVFLVEGLEWGAYTLVETKAPPGYVLDATEHPFTVGVDEWVVGLGPIRNVAHEGPVLPLTGGIGRDQIILAGAFVALLAAVGYGARRRFARGA